jgi:hypothetical protein
VHSGGAAMNEELDMATRKMRRARRAAAASPEMPKKKTAGDFLEAYEFPAGRPIREDIRGKFGFDGDLLEIFASNTGPVVNKWHHYIPLYERYFRPYRNTPVHLLEIGVARGGSLDIWRKYFGPEAVIYGIDIDPDCAKFDGKSGQVRIGSQADPEFLRTVAAEMGHIDIVLDDGSHEMAHIEASLRTLFPLLSNGGIYMIEDLHTAYWRRFGGGISSSDNFFAAVRRMTDDMHHWYHNDGVENPELAGFITGIHVHDSMVVIDKAPVYEPTYSRVGTREKRKQD